VVAEHAESWVISAGVVALEQEIIVLHEGAILMQSLNEFPRLSQSGKRASKDWVSAFVEARVAFVL